MHSSIDASISLPFHPQVLGNGPWWVQSLPDRVAAGFPSPADDHQVQRVDLMAQLMREIHQLGKPVTACDELYAQWPVRCDLGQRSLLAECVDNGFLWMGSHHDVRVRESEVSIKERDALAMA